MPTEAKLQELVDHHDIVRLLAEYCHGCDRGDARLMASVYAQDSWDDHGIMQAPGKEFADLMMKRVLGETDALSHHLGQSLIRIDGDDASAETYFIAAQRRRSATGVDMCEQLGGRYVDRLKRASNGWEITDRKTVRDWSISLKVEEDFFLLTKLTDGTRDTRDAGVAAMTIAHADR